jgi:SRSO17 transposase
MNLESASSEGRFPVAWWLYLPQSWACDADRRKKVDVPEEIGFQPKIEIAVGLRNAAAPTLRLSLILL